MFKEHGLGWMEHILWCGLDLQLLVILINLWESSLVYILALVLVGNVRAGTTVPDKVQHPVPARAFSHGEGVGWKE